MRLLAIIIMLCFMQSGYAEEEPTIYLQPHGPIETRMVLWRLDKPRRAVKRGVISSTVLDIATNVVVMCIGRKR